MPPESVKKGHSEEEYIKLGQWAKSYNYGDILIVRCNYENFIHTNHQK